LRRPSIPLERGASYENLQDELDSLRNLAALDFDTAVFGHGKPIMAGASQKFRAQFAS
jgi:hypothetical protein